MRIAILTQVYPPEHHPTAVMAAELSEFLTDRGWDVTTFAGLPNHPAGRIYAGWKWRAWRKEREGSCNVVRSGHLINPSRQIAMRGAVYFTQAASSALSNFVSERFDLLLVYGPPLVGACLASILKCRHRSKLANIIYDIYPDVAVETGKVSNPGIIKLARLAEQLQYRASDITIVLSEGFKRTLISRGVAPDRIAVVPVWLDPNEIRPMNRLNAWRRSNGIADDVIVVLYAGTIGVVSGATMVAETASILRNRTDILFLFVGDGEEKDKLQAKASALDLPNIKFLPFQKREYLAEIQATGDIGLVTLAPGRGRTSVPSKVLGYMAAGRPVVASVDIESDTSEEIKLADCGIVVSPGDAKALASAIGRAADDATWRKERGERARDRMVAFYSRDVVLKRFGEILEELANC